MGTSKLVFWKKVMVSFLFAFGLFFFSKTEIVRAEINESTFQNDNVTNIIRIEEITQAEFDDYDLTGWIHETATEICEPALRTRTGYTIDTFNKTYNVYVDNVKVAIVECTYTIYDYGLEKVHLYSRTINSYAVSGYSSTITYGTITNTDGSYSTVSDKLEIFKDSKRIANVTIVFKAWPGIYGSEMI